MKIFFNIKKLSSYLKRVETTILKYVLIYCKKWSSKEPEQGHWKEKKKWETSEKRWRKDEKTEEWEKKEERKITWGIEGKFWSQANLH